jgi:hypothetical protein
MKLTRHIVLCAGVIALAAVGAFSQITPTSGALLAINGTAGSTAVNIRIYDSQIHSGVVQAVPPCSAADQIPTDAYVLQGGSATGCDPGDDFEVTDNNQSDGAHQAFGHADVSGFHIETHYLCGGSCGATTAEISPVCNTSGTICASPDNGFVTITNNTGSTFSGTISLTGKSPVAGDPWCPVGGAASDTWASGLTTTGAGQSVTLALGSQGTVATPKAADSSNCGGFNAAQTLTLTPNQTSTAFFGKDDYQIKPLNSTAGAKLDVLPVPVPAGPTGIETSVAASSLYFNPGANFSTLKCIPYADFSAANNPVCVELQLTPSDAGSYLYTAQNDFNIDAHSLPTGVGGPSFLGHHTVTCPDSGFDINTFFSYTAPDVTNGDPIKTSGGGTGSCWVAAFDPNAGAIPTGTTFSFFVGFQSPVSDTDLNLVKSGQSIPLIFQLFSSPGFGNPNFSLCPSQTVPTNSSCPTSGVSAPWVWFGTITTQCMVDNSPNTATETPAAGNSALQNFGNGNYQYNLKTVKGTTGCFDAVLIFDSGLTLFPANFKFKN